MTLKQVLKANRLTYAEMVRRLDMSEANVKRMFASQRFTLEWLEQICRLMQMELSGLFQLYEASRQRVTQLTVEQEQELVADAALQEIGHKTIASGGAVAIQNLFEHLAMLLASGIYAFVAGIGANPAVTMVWLGVLVMIMTLLVSWHLPRDSGDWQDG